MKRIFFILMLVSQYSCEWEPSDVYKIEIENNSVPPEVEIVELSFELDQDTVDLFFDEIYYNFQSSDQKILWINFYINGILKGRVDTTKGVFKLVKDDLYDFYHKLKVELYTRSGTGSIADITGNEGFLFETKEWTIKVHKNENNNIIAYCYNGLLKLKWNADGNRIYTVYRHNVGDLISTTSDEYIDSSYVGEGSMYYLRTEDNFSYGFVQYPKESPELKYCYDENNNFTLAWNEPKFYNAIDSIKLYARAAFSSWFELIESYAGIGNTEHTIKDALFGDKRYYMVSFKPKKYINLNNNSNTVECIVGYPSPKFRNFFVINNKEFIFHTDIYNISHYSLDDSLFRYNTEENKIVDRFRYDFPNPWTSDNLRSIAVSPNGNYLVAYLGDYSSRVFFTDGYDFDNYKVINLGGFSPLDNMKLKISDTGIGLFVSNNKIHLYDFISESLIGEFNRDASSSLYDISSDGKHFFFYGYSYGLKFYSYINNIITIEDSISSTSQSFYDYLTFNPNDPDKLVGWDTHTEKLYLLNFYDLEITNSYSIPELNFHNIDFFNNTVMTGTSSKYVIRKLSTGEILHEIPINAPIFYYYSRICGNSVFYQDGARYFLN